MTDPAGKNQVFIVKLSEIIHANLDDENFGVKEFAKESGMSQYTLYRRLYSITGKTISRFIRETRLQKALEMIQNEDVTASEVAYKVGFNSPTYFNKCFHEFFGYPPGQVKKIIPDNAKESGFVKVRAIQHHKRPGRRTFIILLSGFLFFVVMIFVSYSFFWKNSTPYAGNNVLRDIDGNVYRTLKIGTQIWLAEDLKTTKYNDGTAIPYVADDTEWKNLKSEAYCWYKNNESTKTIYGALYNWYATNTGKLCPVGWHVSTDSDWETLTEFCGGWEIAGGKIKEAGTKHWESPNIGATNEFGFTALPGGIRACNGKCSGLGRDVAYWCPPRCGDLRSLCCDRAWIYLTEDQACGALKVRCVKDKKPDI